MFPENQTYVLYDFESRSEVDLKAVGAWEYSIHPSTQIMWVSWRVGTRKTLANAPIKSWSPFIDKHPPTELCRALEDKKNILVARNAYFEQVITRNVLYRKNLDREEVARLFDPSRFICTASLAAALALPRSLEGTCEALKLPIQKDMEGNRLVKKYCKPRKPTKHNKDKWHRKLSELKRIGQYCETDVAADTLCFLALPPLHEKERQVWLLDQKINLRGIGVDRELVSSALQLIKEEVRELDKRTEILSQGVLASTTKNAKLLKWINSHGLSFGNLQAKTIIDALAEMEDLPDNVREMLEIRQAVAKTSTKKYKGFEMRSRTDGKVRDMLLYHGASPGRWASVGINLQNLARPTIKDPLDFTEVIKTRDLEYLKLLHPKPMEVLSSCLRSVIVPRNKKAKFYCGDFASIEARVAFWLADHSEGLQAYRDGRDLYCEQAEMIYGRKITKLDILERFLGKKLILGAQYGIGWEKFLESCKKEGLIVTPQLAQKAVNAYRKKHYPVPQAWSNFERAAKAATKNRGKSYSVGHVIWFVKDDILWCELPSQRKLAFFNPRIKIMLDKFGRPQEALFHMGINMKAKTSKGESKWQEQKTWGGILFQNITEAVSRDLLVFSILRLEPKGYEIDLLVHDEALTENENGSLKEFKDLMSQKPAWGKFIPVGVEEWEGDRYRK